MIGPRRRFLPFLEDALERRLVMSHSVPTLSRAVSLPQAIAIKYGSQTHPMGWAVKAGSTKTITYNTSGIPHRHQLVFSVRPIRSPLPLIAAEEAIDPNLNSFKLSFRNESNHAFSFVTYGVKLNPGLRYVPGNEHLPPFSNFTKTTDSNGVETLILALPKGIPAKAADYLIFQTKYYK
jgi:hypothetical protein